MLGMINKGKVDVMDAVNMEWNSVIGKCFK